MKKMATYELGGVRTGDVEEVGEADEHEDHHHGHEIENDLPLWQRWSAGALFAHLMYKYHPLLRLFFPSEQIEASFSGLLFSMTVVGSQFLSALFFESAGIAPPECEQMTPDPRLQILVGILSGAFKVIVALSVVFVLRRDYAYVRTLREKRRKLWWWAFKERVGKLFSCVYIAFCTFYVACFCAIVSDETHLAYENTSSTALFAVIVIKPACYVLPLYSVLILQRCHNFWLLERLLDRFPDLTDFSFESKFLEARKKLDEGHHWLEAAPLAAGAGMFWAAVKTSFGSSDQS